MPQINGLFLIRVIEFFYYKNIPMSFILLVEKIKVDIRSLVGTLMIIDKMTYHIIMNDRIRKDSDNWF